MALYVSLAARRRRTIAVAVAVGLVALVLGWLIGRQQVPSIDARVSSVQAHAQDIATGIERLDIEYEQALAGAGDSIDAGVLAPLDGLRTELISTMDRAPWLSQAQRDGVLDELAGVATAASERIPLEEMQARLGTAASSVREVFGLSPG